MQKPMITRTPRVMAKEAIPEVVLEKYSIGEEIARGKFGIVYHCDCKASTEAMAMKIMPKRRNKAENVNKEVSILKKLDHPGIVRLTDFMDCHNVFVLVTALLKGPELFDYLSEKDYLEEKEARMYIRQLLEAIAYCHERKIIHLDLKPENIVMKDPGGGQLTIVDFGNAQDLSVIPDPRVLLGTPEFVAPEVLNYDPASPAADMWAVGVITYVLLTGLSPFLEDTKSETLLSISKAEFVYPDPCPEVGYEDISYEAKSFINKLLKLNPEERDTALTSLTHVWLLTSESQRLATIRLRAFKARKRWWAATTVARVSLSLLSGRRSGSFSTSISDDTASLSPGPEDTF